MHGARVQPVWTGIARIGANAGLATGNFERTASYDYPFDSTRREQPGEDAGNAARSTARARRRLRATDSTDGYESGRWCGCPRLQAGRRAYAGCAAGCVMTNRTKHTPSSTCPGHPFDPTLCVACENDALTADNARLREALLPFARVNSHGGCDKCGMFYNEHADCGHYSSDTRKARAALAKGD